MSEKVSDKIRGLVQVEDGHSKKDDEWGGNVGEYDEEGNNDRGNVSVGIYQ